MKKSLLFGLLAVLAAVFIFTACDNGTTTEYEYIPVPGVGTETLIHIDVVVSNQGDLEALLVNEDYADKVIGVDTSITVNGTALEIPAGYTVYLLNGTTLATDSGYGLTVAGTLWVGYGGILSDGSGGDPIVVAEGGLVRVVTGGALSIASVASIVDEETPAATVLGTGKVTVSSTGLPAASVATLTVNAVADATELAAAFGSLNSGALVVTTATADVKPSEAAALATTVNKTVTIEANKPEDATSLIIPTGLVLTTTDALTSVTSLTVNGTFDVGSAALANVINLTVNGLLDADTAATFAAATTVIVNGTLNAASGTFAAATSIAVGDGGALVINGAALNLATPALSTAGEGVIITTDFAGLTELNTKAPDTGAFNIGLDTGVDIDVSVILKANVNVVILGATTIGVGAADVAVTVGNVIVWSTGTLTVEGGPGEAGGGKAALVEKVTAKAGSTIIVTGGVGTSGAGVGGAATIGDASEPTKKIAFEGTVANPVIVTVTGGAYDTDNGGGDASLYTSNVVGDSSSFLSNNTALIVGTDLSTVTGGTGSASAVTATTKSVIVTGATS